MLDENFKIWLIEVNTNPCLETSTSFLYKLITSMIDNAFSITIDSFYRASEKTKKTNFPRENEPFKTNNFCCIFSKKLTKS